MNWFSLDSVILIIYSDLQLFAIFILGEIDFSGTYLMSAENNSRFLAYKFDPPTRLVPSAPAIKGTLVKQIKTTIKVTRPSFFGGATILL